MLRGKAAVAPLLVAFPLFAGCVAFGYSSAEVGAAGDGAVDGAPTTRFPRGTMDGSAADSTARDARNNGPTDAATDVVADVSLDVSADVIADVPKEVAVDASTNDASDAAVTNSQVQCGPLTCDLTQGNICCLTDYPGFPDVPGPEDYSCQPQSLACAYELGCDGQEDCSPGTGCCLDRSGSVIASRCVDSCEGEERAPIECSHASECAPGELCCGKIRSSPLSYEYVQCATQCDGDDLRIFCESNSDCTGEATCRESTLIPGRTVCRRPDQ